MLLAHPELAYPDTDTQYLDYLQYYQQQGTVMPGDAVGTSAPQETAELQPVHESYYAKQAALSRLLIDPVQSSHKEVSQAADHASEEKKEEKEGSTRDGEGGNVEEKEGEEEEDSGEDEEDAGGAWLRIKDQSSGAFYYFHSGTGASTWQKPEAFQASGGEDPSEGTDK